MNKRWLDKALDRIGPIVNESFRDEWRSHLETVSKVAKSDRLLKKIACASDAESVFDYFAEVRYALVFASLGFDVQVEPLGQKGPDLQVDRDNQSALVEVKRFRRRPPNPLLEQLLQEQGYLVTMGDVEREFNTACAAIIDKFRQVRLRDRNSIIALWSDWPEGTLSVPTKAAVTDLQEEPMEKVHPLPNGLLFVVYGPTQTGVSCYPFQRGSAELFHTWQKELCSSSMSALMHQALKKLL